jgi:hypothetical protein
MVNRPEFELIALLNAEAAYLHASAPAIGASLSARAADIARESTRDRALIDLNRFAHHYKGMLDLNVSGVSQADWSRFVHAVRHLVRASVRSRGLDPSLIGRLYALLHKVRHEA